jgi:hypothetical protein
MSISNKMTGTGAIALAIVFNLPFSYLAQHFGYPDILRHPAEEVLNRFMAGGDGLIWAWYVFGLTALMFVPMGIALSISKERMQRVPALAIGAALTGALAGLVQGMGLLRWVFVVPGLARDAGSEIAQGQFALMNAYAGVAIGEHMGQIFTALFVGLVAAMQFGERKPVSGSIGVLTVLAMLVGSGGGLALALGESDALFSGVSVAAYLGLTLWLIVTGIGLVRSRPAVA